MITPLTSFAADFLLPNDRCFGVTVDLRRIIFDYAWISTPTEAAEILCTPSTCVDAAGNVVARVLSDARCKEIDAIIAALCVDHTAIDLLISDDTAWFHFVTEGYEHLRRGPIEEQRARGQAMHDLAYPMDVRGEKPERFPIVAPVSDIDAALRLGSVRRIVLAREAKDRRAAGIDMSYRGKQRISACLPATIVVAIAMTTDVEWGVDRTSSILFCRLSKSAAAAAVFGILLNRLVADTPREQLVEICELETGRDMGAILTKSVLGSGCARTVLLAATKCLLRMTCYSDDERMAAIASWYGVKKDSYECAGIIDELDLPSTIAQDVASRRELYHSSSPFMFPDGKAGRNSRWSISAMTRAKVEHRRTGEKKPLWMSHTWNGKEHQEWLQRAETKREEQERECRAARESCKEMLRGSRAGGVGSKQKKRCERCERCTQKRRSVDIAAAFVAGWLPTSADTRPGIRLRLMGSGRR